MNDLLTLLSENARLTAAQLAVMLNKTEAEVAAAVKSYEESGVIKGYKALIDWDKAPVKSASAIIELKVTPKKETGFDEIARRVMAFDEVESVYLMAGAYDFAVIVRAATIQDIAMFVAKRLSTLDSVISTATHFVLTRYKDSGMILCDDCDVDERGDMWL
jgi:hypothetical protein